MGIEINDREYAQIQAFIFDAVRHRAGAGKKHLVTGQGWRRPVPPPLRQLQRPPTVAERPLRGRAEAQQAIDLLTTNETYFFREPQAL